jgi:DNA modification methylase
MKQGETYKLGQHILSCGSSLDKDTVDRSVFMMGENIRTIITDPPYGVAYVESKENFAKLGKKNVKKIAGDQLQTEEEYVRFTKRYLELAKPHLTKYNSAYIFNSDLMLRALRTGIEEAGFYYSQTLIWVKSHLVIGRKDYLPMHELIAYGWYGRHKMERCKSKSVLFYPKMEKSKLHPTQKPVGLIRKLIPDNTKIGEVVYDPFAGAGSTLIACEQLKRKCIAIDMEPEYCQTIIDRWEKLTGKKVEKVWP